MRWSRKRTNNLLTILCIKMTIVTLAGALPTSRVSQNAALPVANNVSSSAYQTLLNSSNSNITNYEALQYIVTMLSGGLQLNTTTTQPTAVPRAASAAGRVQPALLDYENETEVEDLEKKMDEAEEVDAEDLPQDVYEVPWQSWINEEDKAATPTTPTPQESGYNIDETQRIIADALLSDPQQYTTPGPHTIRHRGRRLATRNTERRGGSSSILPLQVDNINLDNIQHLFQQQQQAENEQTQQRANPMNIIQDKDTFNLTLDYQTQFRNVSRNKLLEIWWIMNMDCTSAPSRRIVRWVSGMRGILFECKNGNWVVTYLARRQRKPRPAAVTDCHEIHMQGLDLEDRSLQHQLVISYSNGERKSKDVICKHDDRHTNHQLIDNRINADPNQPVLPVQQTMSGGWTVIQRREDGGTKFYRSMKRYKRGFGRVESGEYWIGLDTLHEATHARDYMLRVEVTDGSNVTYFSEYSRFRVGSEAKSYRLRLGSFIQPANSNLSTGDFLTLHHGGKFHTRDSDKFAVNCARLYGTAFWFRGCWAAVNLNGPYIKRDPNNSGVRWATANPNEVRRVWKTEMMIKPIL